MRHIYFFIILLKAVLNYSSKLLAISTTYYLYLWSEQESVCDKNNAPSVSSISRVLRGGHVSELCTSGDEGRTNHSIDGILGKPKNSARHFNCIWSVLAVTCMVRVKYVIYYLFCFKSIIREISWIIVLINHQIQTKKNYFVRFINITRFR